MLIFATMGWSLSRSGPRPWVAWLLLAVWAAATEALQLLVPTRGPSPWDVLLDVIAASTAFVPRREGSHVAPLGKLQ